MQQVGLQISLLQERHYATQKMLRIDITFAVT